MIPELVPSLWRAVATSADLAEVCPAVLEILRPHVTIDHLLVRLLEADRLALDTLGLSSRRGVATMTQPPRNVLDARSFNEVVGWVRNGRPTAAPYGVRQAVLDDVVPPVPGHRLVGPLRTAGDLLGVVAVVRQGAPYDAREVALFDVLLDPLAVALANHVKLHELTRSREALEADKRALLTRLDRQNVTDVLIGGDTGLSDVLERVNQVGPTDVPVLLLGETGTGKEVIARALHAKSKRAAGPVVRVNCGAIAPGLVDSELFGHEKGSFTGAVAARQGWFERADGGTLFLDEIGELPLDAQVRLLRILQDGTFERVGGQRVITVDVRVVAATHRNLEEMVEQGTFRQDLWYRLSVFPIRLPPLRERPGDIPLLAAHYAWRAGIRLAGAPLTVHAADLQRLVAYSWPGNVRELAAVIERAAILGGGHELKVAAALGSQPAPPSTVSHHAPTGAGAGTATASAERVHHDVPVADVPASRVAVDGRVEQPRTAEPLAPGITQGTVATYDDFVRSHILEALERSKGRIQGEFGAALLLDLNPFTLRSKMRKLGIVPRQARESARRARGVGGRPSSAAGPVSPLAPFDEAVRGHIERVLARTGGRVDGPSGAARLLRVNPFTLRSRIRRLGIDVRALRRSPAS